MEDQLILTASDLETTMSATIKVESQDSGMIALPARLILDTLKTFPEQPLTFVKTENNTVEISANNGKYSVAFQMEKISQNQPKLKTQSRLRSMVKSWQQPSMPPFLHRAMTTSDRL